MRELLKFLDKYNLPLYLKGFIKYYETPQYKKFLIIKVYKYLEKINPYEKGDIKFEICQGYALFEICSYENPQTIDFKEFNEIITNRITNESANKILKLSIKLLNNETHYNFQQTIDDEILSNISEIPKITDVFDDKDYYYKDLENQLRYYLFKYEKSSKTCKIITENDERILWLNFIKILLLNLTEDKLEKNEIKIIFYFIVNLFNPDIDDDSLEFKDDALPILFCQCGISNEILEHPEIYKFVDKNYQNYYPKFVKENTFKQAYINLKNEEIFDNPEIDKLQQGEKIKSEIENILKYNTHLPFPLLNDYLKTKNKIIEIEYSVLPPKLLNYYKNCYNDYNNSFNRKSFIENFVNAQIPIKKKNSDIQTILDDNDFIHLIDNIMVSPVMKDAYNRIYIWYSTNGEFDINKEKVVDEDYPKENDIKYNLINGKTIKDYYDEFCKKVGEIKYNKRFIVMPLPETIKGFTFRFLKIVINSQGTKIKINNENISNKIILLKAYLVFVVIHEINHFMKRYFNKNVSNDICKTPVIKGSDDEGEGGKQLIKLLFGDVVINKFLNVEQAKYILNLNNWNKQSVYEFKKDFMKIDRKNDKDGSIVYLSSEKESICDHSKLFA